MTTTGTNLKTDEKVRRPPGNKPGIFPVEPNNRAFIVRRVTGYLWVNEKWNKVMTRDLNPYVNRDEFYSHVKATLLPKLHRVEINFDYQGFAHVYMVKPSTKTNG